jgi:glycosyltransferase involved in cell wall biosynthesis
MKIGIVAIGRNEGERLRACLLSAVSAAVPVAYADSGSRDGSVDLARSLGVPVVELDAPYTAARARNAGFHFLLGRNPDLDAIQFVDGDCAFAEGWLRRAASELDSHPEAGAICGRRRERFPQNSLFNRLCDLEWDGPAGEVDYFGGDVLVRVPAFLGAGGYRGESIAGEEPELSLRLRRQGWKIVRLADGMTWHDADMIHVSQWWRRAVRAGYAYAEGAWLHGREAERHWVRDSLRISFWGIVLPLAAVAVACVYPLGVIPIGAGYPTLFLKIYRRKRSESLSRVDAALYAGNCVAAKFPQALGQIRFLAGAWTGRRSRLIEYKAT